MTDSDRLDFQFSLTSAEKGQIKVRMLDRINVDDVLLHLINRELHRIKVGKDVGAYVEPPFKDFLLQQRALSR